jgi:hypothetical protein
MKNVSLFKDMYTPGSRVQVQAPSKTRYYSSGRPAARDVFAQGLDYIPFDFDY